MKRNLIIGYIFLFLGIAIIFYSIFSSFNIFTGKITAPEIFKLEAQKIQKGEGLGLEDQFQQMIGEQLKGLIPENTLPAILNLVSWSIFAGILIFGGMQISNIGIKLLK